MGSAREGCWSSTSSRRSPRSARTRQSEPPSSTPWPATRTAGTDLVLTLRADRLAAVSGHRPFARTARARSAPAGGHGRGRPAQRDRGPGAPGRPAPRARSGRPARARGLRGVGRVAAAVPRPRPDLGAPRGSDPDRRGLPGLGRHPGRGRAQRRAGVPGPRRGRPTGGPSAAAPAGRPARARASRPAAGSRGASWPSDASHEEIVEMLVAARLVTSDGETVELAHESLARAWPRLRGWLDADTEGQLILRHLTHGRRLVGGHGRARTASSTAGPGWRRRWSGTRPPRRTSPRSNATSWPRARRWRGPRPARPRNASASRRGATVACAGCSPASSRCSCWPWSPAGSRCGRADRADTQARPGAVRELAAASRAARDDDPELAVLLALEATSPDPRRRRAAPAQAVEALHVGDGGEPSGAGRRGTPAGPSRGARTASSWPPRGPRSPAWSSCSTPPPGRRP